MRVLFTRAKGNRYRIAIEREHGPPLEPRFAPGYDDYMPHDLAHYVIEERFEIELGVFGQLAAGGGGIFSPAPKHDSLAAKRTARRLAAIGRADMERSERLVGLCVSEWQRRSGRRRSTRARDNLGEASLADGLADGLANASELDSAVRRLDEVAARWHGLEPGRSLTFEWPKHLTFNAASSHRGRQTQRLGPNKAGTKHGRRAAAR
jgi:hypothetical protein